MTAPFWCQPTGTLLASLGAQTSGLPQIEVDRRLGVFGPNRAEAAHSRSILRKLDHRILNPLVAILLAAAAISGISGDIGSIVIIVSVIASLVLDIVQEHRAELAADKLRQSVAIHVDVLRDGPVCTKDAEPLPT